MVFYMTLLLPFVIHSVLLFLQCVKTGSSQFEDFLTIRLSNVPSSPLLSELLQITVDDDYRLGDILRVFFRDVRIIRALGLIPMPLYAVAVILEISRDAWIKISSSDIAIYFAVLALALQAIYSLWKLANGFLDILIKLHPRYETTPWFLVFFDIYPVWKGRD